VRLHLFTSCHGYTTNTAVGLPNAVMTTRLFGAIEGMRGWLLRFV
jgi:hypothetical protein